MINRLIVTKSYFWRLIVAESRTINMDSLDITATEEEALAKKESFFSFSTFLSPKTGKGGGVERFPFLSFCVHLFLKRGGGVLRLGCLVARKGEAERRVSLILKQSDQVHSLE